MHGATGWCEPGADPHAPAQAVDPTWAAPATAPQSAFTHQPGFPQPGFQQPGSPQAGFQQPGYPPNAAPQPGYPPHPAQASPYGWDPGMQQPAGYSNAPIFVARPEKRGGPLFWTVIAALVLLLIAILWVNATTRTPNDNPWATAASGPTATVPLDDAAWVETSTRIGASTVTWAMLPTTRLDGPRALQGMVGTGTFWIHDGSVDRDIRQDVAVMTDLQPTGTAPTDVIHEAVLALQSEGTTFDDTTLDIGGHPAVRWSGPYEERHYVGVAYWIDGNVVVLSTAWKDPADEARATTDLGAMEDNFRVAAG